MALPGHQIYHPKIGAILFPSLDRSGMANFICVKRLLYLFPFYILFLSGVPCSPYDGCCDEELNIAAHSTKTAGKTDHKMDSPCSPFFACGANHGVVIPDLQIDLALPATLIVQLQFLFSERPLLAFIPSVWQPPKSA
jgi:hypothetical protein